MKKSGGEGGGVPSPPHSKHNTPTQMGGKYFPVYSITFYIMN